uniref:Uncharacterized LOC105919083 n=2 Tax=Fundulus heteroclitus TaxID=8078 RepID=A0A3Q2Q5S0_FUNHE
MTVCLYKCLTAAGLQRHYARFTLMGVYQATHLSTLRMEDYALLGVCSMEDRARLFQLVQLVKSLDIRNLTYDDIGIYNESHYEGSDAIFPAHNSSFSPDGYGNPDGDGRKDADESGAFRCISNGSHCRPSSVRRRLDFSAENTDHRLCCRFEDTIHVYASHNRNDDQVHESVSATPIQPGFRSSAVMSDLRHANNSNLNERSFDSHNGESIKHITRGTSVFNSHIRLLPKSKTLNNTRPAPVTLESSNNKPSSQKDRKAISRKKICSTVMSKPTPVYEAKRTAGYNYGLPLSSPQAAKHVEGQRISVCVRKRPLTRAECRRGEADVVTTPSGECVVVHESKEAVDLTEYILQHTFHFDQVFGEESSNEEVYEKTAYPLVQHMLSGGKATCFAYGQTGAGKTHTMLGSPPRGTGLYALAVRDIFAHLSATRASRLVYVSFFEIYCGQLYDLLEHRKRLFAREDGKKMVHISGLRDVRVDSVSSLLKVISQGTAARTQGMSGVNPLSSRSHALLQIQLRDLNQQIAGRIWFVDLAGSERASDAKEPNKQSRMEGAEINQSLLALKECIRSLDKEESHTPFRQSKLTQVLKDSFVGDSMTCMIANISPGSSTIEHTLNTLRYADRVKELRGQTGPVGRGRRSVSDKNNSSGSGSNRRNVGTLKNPNLGNRNLNFSPRAPTTRSHMWDTVFCSTPKKTTCGEGTQPRDRKDVPLKHISPMRGWLTPGDGRCLGKGPELRRDSRPENERYNDIHGCCVKGKHSRAWGMLGQQNKGKVSGADLAVCEGECGFHPKKESHQRTVKGRKAEEPEGKEMRRQVDSCRDEEEVKERELYKADSYEKVKRLREYHEQLQRFLPSPASSSVYPLSPSARPSSSSLLHSSHSSFFTQMDPCLEETSHVQTETSTNNGENVTEEDKRESERKVMAGAAAKVTMRREDKRPSGRKGGEIRCCWVGSTEMESVGVIPTNAEANLSCRHDSEVREDVRLQRLESRDRAWSQEQKGVSDHCSRNPLFDSPHLQAIAERPLSPVCEDNSKMSVLPQDGVCRDSLSCIVDPLSICQLDVDQQAAQGDNSNTSICPDKSDGGKDGRRETGKGCPCYVDKVEELMNDEYAEFDLSPLALPHLEILEMNTCAISDTPTAAVHRERQKNITTTVSGRGANKPSSIYDHVNNEKKQSTLGKNESQSVIKPGASPFIQSTDDSGSHSSHNTLESVHNMPSKPFSNVSSQHSGALSGYLNSAPPNYSNSSKVVVEPNNPAELSIDQQIEPTIRLFTMDKLDHARFSIIEAHLEQLKEMEAICHKEGELLCQQHDMAFVEFVHKLAEILEKKARCVHSMRAQLRACLKTNHHPTQDDYDNAIMCSYLMERKSLARLGILTQDLHATRQQRN